MRICLLTACLIIVMLCVSGPAAPAWAQLSGETLLESPPAQFKVGYQTHNPQMNMTEMVPERESVDDWSAMITTQVFYKLAKAQPADFLKFLAGKWLGACPGSTHGDLNNGNANGYHVSMLLLVCPNNPGTGKPETTLFRAIEGTQSLYVVQYAFRHEETPDLVSKAAHFLATVNVCDTGSAGHPCPDLKAEGFSQR